jgi:hypothetical protein
MNLGSNTFGNPLIQMVLTKLAILSDFKHPQMLCLALQPHQKVPKLDFQSEFSMPKIIRIILYLFFIEK